MDHTHSTQLFPEVAIDSQGHRAAQKSIDKASLYVLGSTSTPKLVQEGIFLNREERAELGEELSHRY